MICRSLPFVIICAVATLACSLAAQTAATGIPQGAHEVWPPAGVVQMCQCDQDPPGINPVAVKTKNPHYTKGAMDARIQGAITIEAVIETNGTVGDVRVVRSLDKKHGLDDEAVKAVKRWKFKPGRAKDGNAVLAVIRFRGHLSKGEYDVQTDGRHTEATSPPPVH